ncbi:hypothetical protein [Streptomyces sp. NBC_01373]|uniref:hypothetical protein n=1 Tax=Streptomyces sp. NBC_01373 TaxID=2903843 RepID=UPI002255886A|nr:hypothetical protein [Streptomyces sp. NBC_01373]MCX4698675.1 hypothetical protein [Streptomyces sp. NBC_01373]
MTAPPRLPLEGQPATGTGRRAAEPGPPLAAVGARRAVAEGVPSALRSEKFRSDEARHSTPDPTPDQPGIRIYAPPLYRHHWDGARWSKRQGDTPNAAYACSCGQTGTATGAPNVAALAAEYAYHETVCAGAPAAVPERRNAA